MEGDAKGVNALAVDFSSRGVELEDGVVDCSWTGDKFESSLPRRNTCQR